MGDSRAATDGFSRASRDVIRGVQFPSDPAHPGQEGENEHEGDRSQAQEEVVAPPGRGIDRQRIERQTH